MRRTSLVLIVAAASAAYSFEARPAVRQAETASQGVDTPSLGYAVNPSGPELRAILGVPGSARFSGPIALPAGTAAIDLAPGQRWALLTRDTDLTIFDPGSGVAADLQSGIPASYSFSPSGNRLALYFQASGTIAVYNGLPSNPVLESTTNVGSLDSLAAGDNGGFVYSYAGRVYFNPGNAADQFLYESPALGPIAFEANTDAVVLVDASSANLVEAAVSGKATRVIATGIGAPDLIFAWSDRAAAASSADGTFWTIDSATGAVSAPQSVPVSRILPTQLQGTLLLSAAGGQPAWLAGPRGISFVPAVQ